MPVIQVPDTVRSADPLHLLAQVICDSIDDLLIRGKPVVVPLAAPVRVSGLVGSGLAVSVACRAPGQVTVQIGSGRLVVYAVGQVDGDPGELTGLAS